MTEQSDANLEEVEAPEPMPPCDVLLQTLDGIVNDVHGAGLAVTLTVPGGIVTGTLVGYATYLEMAATLLRTNEMWAPIAEMMDELRAAVEKTPSEAESGAESNDEPPRYIHLVHARFVAGGNALLVPTSGDGMLWRGRLSEVSGFGIGAFGVGQTG